MLTLEAFQNQYDIETSEITIKNRRFSFFRPRTIEKFINKDDILKNFPLWSKVWEAGLVLADYMAGVSPKKGSKCLEIGCGLGVSGIVAAGFGHRVILTEYDDNALNFARANVLLNDISIEGIIKLDWNNPTLSGSFDYIFGSDVIYNEKDFASIRMFIKKYLKKDGMIILSEGIRETSMKFMGFMDERYHITAKKMKIQSKGQEKNIMLCNLRPKKADTSAYHYKAADQHS